MQLLGSGYGPTQLISEHTFLCTAKTVRRACAAETLRVRSKVVGMYVVSTYVFVEYPRLSLNSSIH